MRKFILVLIIILAIPFLGLVGYHWSRGADLGMSFSMATDDTKVAIRCRDWEILKEFMERDAWDNLGVAFASKLGGDWVSEVCAGNF